MLWVTSQYISFSLSVTNQFKYKQNLNIEKLLELVLINVLSKRTRATYKEAFCSSKCVFEERQWVEMNTSLKISSPSILLHFLIMRLHISVYRCIVLFPPRGEAPAYWYCRDSIVNLFFIDFAAFLVTLWGLTIFWVSLQLIVCVLE